MFHQSMSRHQRAKGSKVKNILQGTVFLAVVVWLLYQTKHSYERKPEYDETNYNKLSKGETDLKLSRKVNAGSGNVIIIDHHGNNSDETTEMEGTGVDQDVFTQDSEEKAKEDRNDSEESREEITNSGKEETQPEQQGYVDDNGESHAEGEVNTDVTQEDLRLRSQRDGDNVDQNENQNEVDRSNSLDENGVSKDGVTDESSTANNQAETGENAEQGSETSETGEHSDNAVPVKEESSSSSASGDQSNKDNSASRETVEAQESTGSDDEVEEAKTNPRSDDSENVNLPSSEVESQVASDSHSEIAGNRSIVVGTTGSSDDGNTNIPKSVEENNVVMADSNGVPVGEDGGSQVDRISEGQTNGNGSIEAVATDTSSEGENANLAGSSEGKGTVMSDANGVPNDDEVQSQMDHVSEGVKTDNSSSEEAKADTADEQSSAEKNSEVSEKEAGVSQRLNAPDAEVTTNNTVEQSNDPKSTDEAANTSQASESENVELPAIGEDAVVGEAQSQGNSGSDGENSGKTPLEEVKSEQSGDLVANSAQNNEQNNSDLTNNETANEAVASHEDGASNVDNTSKNVEDSVAEPESKYATSDSSNNVKLSSGNGSAEGQEGSTSSESSTSRL